MSYVCKLCNLTFKSERKLWKHKISKEHIEKIHNLEVLEIQIPENLKKKQNNVEKLKRDPQLSNDDVKKLDNSGVGYGINVNYSDGRKPLDSSFDKNEKIPPSPSQKQTRILQYLITNQTNGQMIKTFFELLKKLDLPDYKLLSSHIMNSESIDFNNRQKMIKVIELFKKTLIKKKENKETVFNGNQIDEILKLL